MTAESSLPFRGSNSNIQEYYYHSMELQSFAGACTGRAGFAVCGSRVARWAVPAQLATTAGRHNLRLDVNKQKRHTPNRHGAALMGIWVC